MAITHPTAIRTAFANNVLGAIDTGSPTPGRCVLQASNDAEVADIGLNDPSFVNTNGQLVLDATGPLEDTNATGGTVTKFKFTDNLKTTDGFYGVVPDDMTVSSGGVVPAAGTVRLTSYTYNASL